MANKRGKYSTLGRRILSILETGARKYNVLLGYAHSQLHSKKSLDRHLQRLVDAGLIERTDNGRNGINYRLPKRRQLTTAKGNA